MLPIIKFIKRKFVKAITPSSNKDGYPYLYARYYYWTMTRKCLSYLFPKDFNEKLFWLNRYWQHPLVVQCSDKIAVRKYVRECGLSHILNDMYATYNSEDEIDFNALPDSFVLKTNNLGGGWCIVLCKDKKSEDIEKIKNIMRCALHTRRPGVLVADYNYQYIKPQIIAEKFITSNTGNKLEIQFFCFDGNVEHILVRNDLGDRAENSFAISYNLNWERVKERKDEDLNVTIDRPRCLDEMIKIAEILSKPFPHVRVDLYYVDEKIFFGELTFTTSGKVLYNYTDETLKKWGHELKLPKKIKSKWRDYYPIYY